ncbi:serine protease [Roseobacter sp. YSTF-M11]|uniref:Serine protease n=1 Tax=Roseobacter insulae TaxID=2859783 RepID=A0A9X1JXP1_9RHOB|nr:serine protease [Roseobacter insulae]MBW4707475.1 serine protease [Roseobacter insulae]
MFLNGIVRARARAMVFVRRVVFSAVFVLACSQPVDTAEPPRSLSYHATLFNGAIVGSAFMIADGLAITNAHVVKGRAPGDTVILSTRGKHRVAVQVLAVSQRIDLAILAVREGVLPITPAGPARAQRGEPVYAVGIVANSANPRRRLIIQGTVASDRRSLAPFGRGVIATMPDIRRGFSGGPVFDRSGQLVGMVTALRDSEQANGRTREAFILSAEEIRAEIGRLVAR